MSIFESVKKRPFVGLLLSRFGYRVDRKKDCSTWRALVSPRGLRILVPRYPASSGDFLYKSCDVSIKSGSIVKLLNSHHDMSFSEIKGFFSGEEIVLPPQPPIEKLERPRKNQEEEVLKALEKFSFFAKKNPGFCLGSRGIHISTASIFRIPMSEAKIVFPLFELFNGEICRKTSITYTFDRHGKSDKLFQKGLKKGGSACMFVPFSSYSQVPEKRDFKALCICESPIDALSWAQLLLKKRKSIENHLFLATCGSLSHDFKANLPNILDFFAPENVQICMDNDEKGREMTKELIEITKPFKPQVLRLPEGKKDLNDLLA